MGKKILGILITTLLISTATGTIAVNINNHNDNLEINDNILLKSIYKIENSNILDTPPFWWLTGADQKQTSNCNYGDQIFPPLIAAQEFKPTKDNLTAVALGFFKRNPPSGVEITVSIRDALDGSDLAVKTIDADTANIKTRESWVLFDFPDISVTPETTYFIVCSASAGEELGAYLWFFDINNKYDRGIAWFSGDSGETWFDLEEVPDFPQIDFCFITYWQKPKNKAINMPFLNWLQSYTNMFPLLKTLLQRLGLQ